MTPLTLTKPVTHSSSWSAGPPELATQPLVFDSEGRCTNKAVLAAVIDALSDRCSDDQLVATLFENAFNKRYQSQLNQVIKNIRALHGAGAVNINLRVMQLLAEDGLELQQNSDGTVKIGYQISHCAYPERHEAIRLVTGNSLPGDLGKLICAYDDEITIDKQNVTEIFKILGSDDVSAKSLLIAAASRQKKIDVLNFLIAAFRSMHQQPDLSYVDLSGLDLTAIDLSNTNLDHANLRNTTLTYARLQGARLTYANLNSANLSFAKISQADLSYARLIGTYCYKADLEAVKLRGACLVCTNLHAAALGNHDLIDAIIKYGTMQHVQIRAATYQFNDIIRNLYNDSIAYIVPSDCEHDLQSAPKALLKQIGIHSGYGGLLVIHENEKQILLANCIEITDNNDGTWRLSQIPTICRDQRRHDWIDTTLKTCALPRELTSIIAAYDDDIEISYRNKKAITEILKSADPAAKRQCITAAVQQYQIDTLNEIFKELRTSNTPVDLSFVDLSNLDLSRIYLSGANLKHTNFQNSCLRQADLIYAILQFASLNNVNLENADLHYADLTGARLIGANLLYASFGRTTLNHACLIRAQLRDVDIITLNWSSKVGLAFAQFHGQSTPAHHYQIGQNLYETVTAIIVPDGSDLTQNEVTGETRDKLTSARNCIVLSESEVSLLRTKGILVDDNHDGTILLSPAITLHKDSHRQKMIAATLETSLPAVMTDLIKAYDEEIEIGSVNEAIILKMLRSTDLQAKAQIFAAASNQHQIQYLNQLIRKVELLDLSHINLSNLNLSGLDLSGAILNHAILHGCNLDQANLGGVRLINANLNGASLKQADLRGSDLTNARLIGANLSGAICIRTNFHRAVLKFANLTRIDLMGGSDLSGAWLDHANLGSALCHGACLSGASLNHAKLHLAVLEGVNLTNASLQHAELTHTSLMKANLCNADFSHATLERVNLRHVPILAGAIWTGTSFSQIRSDAATMKHMPIRMWLQCTSR